MGGSTGLTSVSGILALLEEDHDEIKEHSLQRLNDVIDEFWPEISDSIGKIEELYETEGFRARKLAALVASKVYYHLEQYTESMQYALGAAELFDVSHSNEFVDTLIAKCIDEYIRLRNILAETRDAPKIDPRLEAVVMGMFDRCFADKRFKQALGIALETRRLDKIEQAISGSDDIPGMLAYAQKVCMDIVLNRDFRHTVLKLLVKIYNTLRTPDYIRISECLVFLDDSKSVADIVNNLLQTKEDDKALLAFQIAFDLVNNSSQQFITNVRNALPKKEDIMPPLETVEEPRDSMDVEKQPLITKPESTKETKAEKPRVTDVYSERIEKLKEVLSGEMSISLNLDFLFRNNNTDLLILKNIKNTIESRSSVLHTSTIFANALMHAGTTSDQFLRDNLEWLSRATNWAKFSAIGGLGVIYKGHLKESMQVLSSYLPQPGSSGSAYSEGGSLYALGLIHANHGATAIPYLTKALHNASGNEIVQHGACLGLGVAAMATGNEEIYHNLKNILYMDSAVAGEAAGLAMGLVMMGTAHERAVEEMIVYAHETQHEKIIRGLAVGLAIVMYGREEGADPLIEQLSRDKDPILRYGAMYTIGLAYCGTSNNSAIRKLLHVAVSDVSDDVRRAAVTCLGFVLFRQPEQCPKVVSLLAESYNPHVRYGACLALGIACSGTGMKEALDILEPLTSDPVDYVRQGALLALAMVLIQYNKNQEPKVESIRKLFQDKINDKHEELMCKFGAILATGLIDAGGRNVTVSLHSRSGHKNMTAIVGLAVFTQFWYWYPLIYFVSLAFTPTSVIGLNKDLKMPVFSFKSNAKPSTFAYPPKTEPPKTVAPTKVKTAVLSIAKKKEQRDKKKTDAMEVDKKEEQAKLEEQKKKEEEEQKKKEEAEKKPPEPDFEIKSSPARVTLAQVKYLSFDVDERYKPVKEDAFGIVMLRDLKPGQPEVFVTASSTSTGATKVDDEPEPQAPEVFEFDPSKEK